MLVLSFFKDIAEKRNFVFLFGEKQAFNVSADTIADNIVLYYEGYSSGSLTQVDDGSWNDAMSVRVWLLQKSEISDEPYFRQPRFESLKPRMVNILNKLSKDFVIGRVEYEEAINQTDHNLDGYRFVFTMNPRVSEDNSDCYCDDCDDDD